MTLSWQSRALLAALIVENLYLAVVDVALAIYESPYSSVIISTLVVAGVGTVLALVAWMEVAERARHPKDEGIEP